MKSLFQLRTSAPEDAKLHFVIGMGLASSVMMRNFKKGSNRKLQDELLRVLPRILSAESAGEYRALHSGICRWGIKNIRQRESNGGGRASYGQIAKTIDVAMKIIVYDCHYPDCRKSEELWRWLNAAIDTKMMAHLRAAYPDVVESWPTRLKDVDESTYISIQKTVLKFIEDRYDGKIFPVQFDDMYWEALNRGVEQ